MRSGPFDWAQGSFLFCAQGSWAIRIGEPVEPSVYGPFDCAQGPFLFYAQGFWAIRIGEPVEPSIVYGPFDWAQGPFLFFAQGFWAIRIGEPVEPSVYGPFDWAQGSFLFWAQGSFLFCAQGPWITLGGFLNAMDYRISTCSPARALFMLRTAQNFPHIEQVSSCSGARLSRIAFAVSGSSAHSH